MAIVIVGAYVLDEGIFGFGEVSFAFPIITFIILFSKFTGGKKK